MKAALDRSLAVAGNTFRGATRMRLYGLLIVTGVASLAGGLFFREFNLGSSELRFIADFGFGSITLLGSIVTVVATVQLLYGEIEHRTALPILAKPISRGEFLIGKLVGAWWTICSFVGIITVALLLALWLREQQLAPFAVEELSRQEAVNYGGVVIFSALQCLRLMILASVTAFFCSYASSSMFAVFMGFFAWILGQLRSVLVEYWGQGEASAFSVPSLVALVIPDLRLFDVGELAFGSLSLSGWDLLSLLTYALVYTALYGSLAAIALRNREL